MKRKRALIKKMLHQELYKSYWHLFFWNRGKAKVKDIKALINELK
jgi:hypothetical protein